MALGVRGVGRGVFRATPAAKCRDALRRVAHLLPLELLRRHVLPDPLFFLPLGLLARRHHPLWCARALLQSGNQLLVSSSPALFLFFKAAIEIGCGCCVADDPGGGHGMCARAWHPR